MNDRPAPGVEDAKRAVTLISDSELLDSVDELYDRMAGGDDRARWYHEIALAEAKRRGIITTAP